MHQILNMSLELLLLCVSCAFHIDERWTCRIIYVWWRNHRKIKHKCWIMDTIIMQTEKAEKNRKHRKYVFIYSKINTMHKVWIKYSLRLLRIAISALWSAIRRNLFELNWVEHINSNSEQTVNCVLRAIIENKQLLPHWISYLWIIIRILSFPFWYKICVCVHIDVSHLYSTL